MPIPMTIAPSIWLRAVSCGVNDTAGSENRDDPRYPQSHDFGLPCHLDEVRSERMAGKLRLSLCAPKLPSPERCPETLSDLQCSQHSRRMFIARRLPVCATIFP